VDGGQYYYFNRAVDLQPRGGPKPARTVISDQGQISGASTLRTCSF
jgi:hypothetical protein